MDALELVKDLESRVKAGKPTKVTKEFLNHFETVAKYYECPPDEVELMKAIARGDMENAKICFESIFKQL